MRRHGRAAEARRAEVEEFLYKIQRAAFVIGQAREEAKAIPDYKPIRGFQPAGAA